MKRRMQGKCESTTGFSEKLWATIHQPRPPKGPAPTNSWIFGSSCLEVCDQSFRRQQRRVLWAPAGTGPLASTASGWETTREQLTGLLVIDITKGR